MTSKLLLDFLALSKFESIHYFDSSNGNYIGQRGNQFFYSLGTGKGSFECPVPGKLTPFLIGRLSRRLARLDKGVCLPLPEQRRLFVFYSGVAYYYDIATEVLTATGEFQFRNPLHGGTAIRSDGTSFFGEYFANVHGREVKVFGSDDFCQSWDVVYTFPKNTIWHVHGVFADPYEARLWISTGDFQGQCKLLTTTDSFKTVQEFGDGGQDWRIVSLFFTKDSLIWGTDTPLAPVHVMRFERSTGKLFKGQPLPGPVWYSKTLDDGVSLLQTSVERAGQVGVQSRYAKIYYSTDLDTWTEVEQFRKDVLPHRYFRNGVMHFSAGPQTSQKFTLHGEALVGFDGKAAIGKLQSIKG